MSPSMIEYLEHIQKELTFLVTHSSKTSYEDYLSDDLISRAYLRSLEIIGEAAKKVPDDIRYKYLEVDCRGMTGLQDVLIHQYFQVDYQLVLKIVKEDIPLAKEWIDIIIKQEKI